MSNGYNLLVTGALTGSTQSSVMIGGDTSTTYGVRIVKETSNNGYVDLRADPDNSISLRHQNNSTGTIISMLSLSNDSSLTGIGYGAVVNGRVNASSYYVGESDTRSPITPGLYMSMDNLHVGHFVTNKGSGTGGFQFSTFNSDGTLYKNHMNLKADGTVQTPYYKATTNPADFAPVSAAGIDASGNLVRNFQTNIRLRTIHSRITALQYDLVGNTPNKINEVVTRLNDLNFFSQPIGELAPYDPTNPPVYVSPSPSPAPVSSYTGLYAFSTFTFTPNNATGLNGPTSLTYSTTTYPWTSQYLILDGGIQKWTVPATASYTFTAAGAQGGSSENGNVGGKGIIISNQVMLAKGDVIYILVGQKGSIGTTNPGAGGGGGGGTFIAKYNGGSTSATSSYNIVLVAGGGGGAGFASNGSDAVATTQGGIDTANYNTPAINGAGGANNASQGWTTGCGGGGWSGTGANGGDNVDNGGNAFLLGGTGGPGHFGGDGGFGGGAGSGANMNWGTGGGGGYSGGSSGSFINSNFTGAGGGGSYDINGSSNNATSSGYNSGDGYVTIAAPSAISGPN